MPRQSLCLRLILKWFELWKALMKSHLKLNWIHRSNGIHSHPFLIGTLDLLHAKQSEKEKKFGWNRWKWKPLSFLHASQTHKIPTRLIFNVFVLCFPLDFRNDSGFNTQIASSDRSNSNGDIYKDLHSTWVFNQKYSNQIFPITYSSYDISIVNANQIWMAFNRTMGNQETPFQFGSLILKSINILYEQAFIVINICRWMLMMTM